MSNFKILNKASIDDAKKIMKDKNASANEKLEKIVDLYCNYYKDELVNCARFRALENNYETIYDANGKANKEKFNECFDDEFANEISFNIEDLNFYVTTLMYDINFKALSKKSELFLNQLADTNLELDTKNAATLGNNVYKHFFVGIYNINKTFENKEESNFKM